MSKYSKKKLRKLHEDWSGSKVVSTKILDEVAVVLDDDDDISYAPISIYPARQPYRTHPIYSSLTVDEAEKLGHALLKMVKKVRADDLD
jgi:hypothetical protein